MSGSGPRYLGGYAMFPMPIAYLIDEVGVITRDVAVGEDAILNLLLPALRERSTV